jgi:PAS domain S-box-containing protein
MPAEGEQTNGAVTAGGATSVDLAGVAERATRRLALLQDIASALAAIHDPREIAEAVVSRIRPGLGARLVSVRLLSAARTLDVVALREDAAGLSRLPSVPLDADDPSADAVRRCAPVWVRSREELATRYPTLAAVAAIGISAAAALPLCVGDRCLGSLGLFFEEPSAFEDEERGLIQSIAVHCAAALDRARLFEAERRARRLAEEAYAELDAIVENAPLGVAFLDRTMRYRRVNRLLAQLNGLTVEQHIGRTPRELFPGLPVDALERQFHDVLATGVPIVEVEVVGENPAVGRHVALVSWYPVQVGGRTEGVGVLVREVTAMREAQEFQRHVLAVVGHDLKNPLSAIQGTAELLRRAGVAERELRLVERIQSSARRMDEIVRAVLDYTLARRGSGVPMERGPCDVAEICKAIALESEAAHPGRVVRCSGSGDTACTWDAGRVSQMLGNLVTNALQHGEPDSPVELRWSGDDDEVHVAVANRGRPIPAPVLARMFEPFERGAAHGGSGLGLGLFIARQVALAHGGRIDVRSAEEGTVFTVVLPRSGEAG